jgi:hypothetical protein
MDSVAAPVQGRLYVLPIDGMRYSLIARSKSYAGAKPQSVLAVDKMMACLNYTVGMWRTTSAYYLTAPSYFDACWDQLLA